jgi:hypothetical protein
MASFTPFVRASIVGPAFSLYVNYTVSFLTCQAVCEFFAEPALRVTDSSPARKSASGTTLQIVNADANLVHE